MRNMVRRVLDIFGSKDISDNYISMETKHKDLYEAPAITILEVKQESVICVSGGLNASMDGTFTEEDI